MSSVATEDISSQILAQSLGTKTKTKQKQTIIPQTYQQELEQKINKPKHKTKKHIWETSARVLLLAGSAGVSEICVACLVYVCVSNGF